MRSEEEIRKKLNSWRLAREELKLKGFYKAAEKARLIIATLEWVLEEGEII